MKDLRLLDVNISTYERRHDGLIKNELYIPTINGETIQIGKKKNLKGSKLEYTKIKNIVLIKHIMKFLQTSRD